MPRSIYGSVYSGGAGGGAGDVVGPATNTDGYIPLWDGANSKTLKNGLDPAGFLTSVTAHDLLSATHGDTTASAVVRGDLIVGTGASPKWDNLTKGAAGKFLTTDANDTIWSTATIPATATGTGTILRADGTNWVATTATYPTTTTDNQILHSTSANVIGGDSKLTFDGSSLSADPDGDTLHSFGRVKIGNGFMGVPATDYATFSHYDNASLGNYALAQSSIGDTLINCATGKSITFSSNNSARMVINDADFKVVDIRHSNTQGLNIYSTVNSAGLLINYGGSMSIQTRSDQSTNGGVLGFQIYGGNIQMGYDNTVTVWGEHFDTSITYDGSNWIFNSRNIGGTGNYQFNGGEIGGDPFSDQMTYKLAGEFLDVLTDPKLLVGWLTPSDGGTEADLSGAGQTITYTASSDWTTGDQLHKGFVWSLDPDGTNDWVTVTANSNLDGGNGTIDWAISMGGWCEFVQAGVGQELIGRLTTVSQYSIRNSNRNTLQFFIGDNSVVAYSYQASNSAISAGWHFVVCTYDGRGGATSANGIKLYIDGVVIASTATNDANYVAMETGSGALDIGAVLGDGSNPWKGDIGMVFFDKSELSASDIWKLYVKTRGYYNV